MQQGCLHREKSALKSQSTHINEVELAANLLNSSQLSQCIVKHCSNIVKVSASNTWPSFGIASCFWSKSDMLCGSCCWLCAMTHSLAAMSWRCLHVAGVRTTVDCPRGLTGVEVAVLASTLEPSLAAGVHSSDVRKLVLSCIQVPKRVLFDWAEVLGPKWFALNGG